MVTPSLVIVGEPYFLPRTTLRPRGPSVTFTELASLLTPRSNARRASDRNARVLAAIKSFRLQMLRAASTCHGSAPGRSASRGGPEVLGPGAGPLQARPGHRLDERELLLEDGEHVAGVEDEVVLAAVANLGAAVLAVEHGVADGDVERNALLAVLVPAARSDREDDALLRLLLGGVRNDDAGRRGGLRVVLLDEDPVLERLDANLRGGGHDLPSPEMKCRESEPSGCRRG